MTETPPKPLSDSQRAALFQMAWEEAFAKAPLDILETYAQRRDELGDLAGYELVRRANRGSGSA